LRPQPCAGIRSDRSAVGIAPGRLSKGYAMEAARAAVSFGFDAIGLPTIFAITKPDNLSSQAVVRRLGLETSPIAASRRAGSTSRARRGRCELRVEREQFMLRWVFRAPRAGRLNKPYRCRQGNVRFAPKSDIGVGRRHVCYGPNPEVATGDARAQFIASLTRLGALLRGTAEPCGRAKCGCFPSP
jgi:hypothetical protein